MRAQAVEYEVLSHRTNAAQMEHSANSANIFIIGPMGAGKTTVGQMLARELKKEFLDSDREIEERTGVRIPVIFEIEGEQGFRLREAKMIEQLTALHDVVLATGGGAVLSEDNRRCLRTRGFVIYLRAGVDKLLQRTRRDRFRPLLQTENPREVIGQLMEIREPLYRETADLVIDTDGRTIRSVARSIVRSKGGPCVP